MSEHDDFDINISKSEDSELTEKEYSDILGLEGMAGGGEAALEENEEEKEEDTLVHILAEQNDKKQKPAYRRYTHEEESEERKETEITVPEHREIERKREGVSANVSLEDNEQLDREVLIASVPTESVPTNPIHTDFIETAYVKPFDTLINGHEQIIHSELNRSENVKQESLQIPMIEHKQNESNVDKLTINDFWNEQDISGYESTIPLEQMENWKNSSIAEIEMVNDEKYNTAEYWDYLQTNVSEYARNMQLENEQLYRDVEVAGISAVFAQFNQVHTDINETKNTVASFWVIWYITMRDILNWRFYYAQ